MFLIYFFYRGGRITEILPQYSKANIYEISEIKKINLKQFNYLSLNSMHHPGLALRGLQELVELFWIKLQALQEPGRTGYYQQQLLDQTSQQSSSLKKNKLI